MPYKFDDIGGENNSFSFTSEIGIVFVIKFKPSPYFLGDIFKYPNLLFEFIIEEAINPNLIKQPFDIKIGETIGEIFECFYENISDSISIYICDSSDRRQTLRMNKFNRWFSKNNKGDSYLQISEMLIDSNNISYPISLIIKKTNPYRLEIIEEFFRLADGYNTGK